MNRMLCPPECPIVPGYRAWDVPVGYVRKLAPAPTPSAPSVPPGGEGDVDETRRNVLKLVAVGGILAAAGGGLVGGTLQYVSKPPLVGLSSYPKVQLIDLDGTALTATKVMNEYNVTTPSVLTFQYPLTNEPNFLINLAPPPGGSGGATNVVGGVGPQQSIVAFSAICQHLGCPAPAICFYPPGTCGTTFGKLDFYIHCSCHGSTYDVTNGAANLTGPAVIPLPQVVLEWDQSDDSLYATNMNGAAVNGHLNTLQGGYGVGATAQLSKQSPVVDCSFPSS
jgi:Rieske Fe-S protein